MYILLCYNNCADYKCREPTELRCACELTKDDSQPSFLKRSSERFLFNTATLCSGVIFYALALLKRFAYVSERQCKTEFFAIFDSQEKKKAQFFFSHSAVM